MNGRDLFKRYGSNGKKDSSGLLNEASVGTSKTGDDVLAGSDFTESPGHMLFLTPWPL